jgi:hypothetical protein
MKQAISKGLWAPIATPERGNPWVMWIYVRATRRDSKAAYLSDVGPLFKKAALERVRFARVDVVEQGIKGVES